MKGVYRVKELIEYLAWNDFRVTFDTTSNGLFRAVVSHPSGKMQTFIGAVHMVVQQIDAWVVDVLKG
jgi:hypothetical protein